MNRLFQENPELFARVAATNPGLVSSLSALLGHLESGELPEPHVMRAYGQMLCRLGAAVIGQADAREQPYPPRVIDA